MTGFRRRLRAERDRIEAEVRADLRRDAAYQLACAAAGPEAAEARLDEAMAGYYRRSGFGRLIGSPVFPLLFLAGKSQLILDGFLEGRAEARRAHSTET